MKRKICRAMEISQYSFDSLPVIYNWGTHILAEFVDRKCYVWSSVGYILYGSYSLSI